MVTEKNDQNWLQKPPVIESLKTSNLYNNYDYLSPCQMKNMNLKEVGNIKANSFRLLKLGSSKPRTQNAFRVETNLYWEEKSFINLRKSQLPCFGFAS